MEVLRIWRHKFVALLVLALLGWPAAAPPVCLLAQTQAAGEKLDINTATAAQLKALPGMGDAYVARVIRGRPYRAKNELTQKGILPDAAYAQIKDRIIAHQPRK